MHSISACDTPVDDIITLIYSPNARIIKTLTISLKPAHTILNALIDLYNNNFEFAQWLTNISNVYLEKNKPISFPYTPTSKIPESIHLPWTDNIHYYLENNTGVWNQRVHLLEELKKNDRIEIYTPLITDPQTARRRRFANQGSRSAGLFSMQKEKTLQKKKSLCK